MSLNLNKDYGVTEVFVKHDYYAGLRVKLIKEDKGVLTLLKDDGDKLTPVRRITSKKKLYTAPEGFLPVELDFQLKYIYEEGEYAIPRYKYIKHKGSSRSSKSWSIEEWCIRKCESTRNFRINVWRDTRTSLGDTIWKDFRKLFPLSGRSYSFNRNTTPIYFEQTSSAIEPHGDDTTNAHGITQDVAWLNEPYKMKKETFDQIDQRAELIIIDMNPREGWAKDLEKHPRCKVIHSTFLLNPFCPPGQKRKILSYNPEIEANIKNGTADTYMWEVYGLGIESERPNKIYHNWERMELNEFLALPYPSYYGMDFGLSNPSAIAEVKYNDGTFYINELLYKPEKDMENGLVHELNRIGMDKGLPLICDSASPEKIMELRRGGYNAKGATKGKGSVFSGISIIQRSNVKYTKHSTNLEFEQSGYEWRTDRIGVIDEPEKVDDHILDAVRYCTSYIAHKLRIVI